MINRNGKIKVIKANSGTVPASVETLQTAKAIKVLHTETRQGAAATVASWISEFRQNKAIEKQKSLQFWQLV